MAIKRLFRKVKSAAGAPGRVIGGAYYGAKAEASKRRSDKIVEDVRVLRGVRESERASNSVITDAGSRREIIQNPDSLYRRKQRVEDFKQEMADTYGPNAKKKKRLFRRN